MRIALITEYFLPSKGGSEIYGLMIGRALLDAGHEVHVVTGDWDPTQDGFIYHKVPKTSFRPLHRYTFAQRASRLIEGERFDVVHAFTRGINADMLQLHGGCHRVWLQQEGKTSSSLLGKLVTRVKRLISVDDQLVLKMERDSLCWGASLLVAVSEMVRDDLMSCYPLSPEQIRVLPNGTDTERFHPCSVADQRKQVRQDLGFEDEVVFLFMGHNFRRKGLRPAIEALARLRDVPNARLLVVGDDRPSRYAGLARKLGCDDRIRYVGGSDEPERWYAAADAVVFPSYYDPFGLIVLEGMACGLPVITSTTTGAAQLITHGRDGFVANVEDIDALARAMCTCLDPEARVRMGAAARKTAEGYSLDRHIEELTDLYCEVVRSKRRLGVVSAGMRPSAPPPPSVAAKRGLRCANGLMRYEALAAIEAHRACVEGGPGDLMKNAPNTRVTIIGDPALGRRLCVKEYRWRGLKNRAKDFVRPSQSMREWRNGLRLKELGVRVATPYALAERRLSRKHSSSYLVFEAVEGIKCLDLYAYETFRDGRATRARKLAFIGFLANYLRHLHERGIFHRDMKPSNLLVHDMGEEWQITLIDFADLSVEPIAHRTNRIRNLAQWNGSMPVVLSRTDRLRFLRAYLGGDPAEADLRSWWDDVLRVTLTRTCIWDRDVPVEGL